jgi:uncharacterized protein YodC (DUF2158 family)
MKDITHGKDVCLWYDGTSGMKGAYDAGMLDQKWIDGYCMKGGQDCVRKKRFEKEGYVSPDYVLPDGTVDEKLKKWATGM